ncbi:MAG: sulfatase-like hydrolase/transferase [Planctomycetes bacterium]|nr:sulfatase-like hydrolase/transferase [Planctomycetota bacterium]
MRTFIVIAMSILSAISAIAVESRAAPPNVLLIYTDDQGSIDLNCYGSKDLATPNLDRLAGRGVRFTQMYAPSAICSASRAGLLTGRFPARAGVPGNVSSTSKRGGLPPSEVTIAEMLKAGGYETAHIGKWHLGHTPETMPNGQGFDYSFGHMVGCIDNYSHFFYWNGPNRHDLWRNGREVWHDGEYFLDLMENECHAFLEKRRRRPFFMYWAINMPHYPMQAAAKWRAHYKDLPAPRRMYAAFVSTVDEYVGRILKKLDELRLSDNTLVIFQSDHGHSTEVRAFGGGGNAGPYRGAKACLFEGGLRVPAIVSLPGTIPQGEVRGQMATGCDWLPTIAELCKVSTPKTKLDGKSLVPVIMSDDAASPHKKFYWQLGSQWVVREGDWKLIGNPRDTSAKAPITDKDKLFLANLAEDVTEMKNRAEDHPDVVQRLKKIRDEYVRDIAKQ